eukprot:4478889-Pyramimonas_sp.AAC.1
MLDIVDVLRPYSKSRWWRKSPRRRSSAGPKGNARRWDVVTGRRWLGCWRSIAAFVLQSSKRARCS